MVVKRAPERRDAPGTAHWSVRPDIDVFRHRLHLCQPVGRQPVSLPLGTCGFKCCSGRRGAVLNAPRPSHRRHAAWSLLVLRSAYCFVSIVTRVPVHQGSRCSRQRASVGEAGPWFGSSPTSSLPALRRAAWCRWRLVLVVSSVKRCSSRRGAVFNAPRPSHRRYAA